MADRLTNADLDVIDNFLAASQKARGVRRQGELLGILVRKIPDLVADLRDARQARDGQAEPELPAQQCGTCARFALCVHQVDARAEQTTCEWVPSCYLPAPKEATN